ncbi:MAG: AbrB family transcriptional regulator [Bacillota bacterium]
MDHIIFLILIFVGYHIGNLLRMPMANFLGPIAFLALVNISGFQLELWPHLKSIFAITLGGLLGLRFTLEDKTLTKIALFLGLWMIVTGVLIGEILIWMGIEPPTAFFSASPGGLAEMGVTAMSFGADTFKVTLLQTFRIFTVLFMIPFVVKRYDPLPRKENTEQPKEKKESQGKSLLEWTKLGLVAFGAAMICAYFNVPAPDLVGPLFGVFFYTRFFKININSSKHIHNIAFMGVGGIIGLGVTKGTMLQFPVLLLPALVLSLLTFVSGLGLAWTLHRITKWDMATCLLGTAPAGSLPMVVMADEMGADVSKVAVLQIVRVFSIVALTPFIYAILL